MDLEMYGLFLVGSILVSLGAIVIASAVLVINHLYDKYWKTVQLFKVYAYEPHNYQEPTIEPTNTANVMVTTNGQN